MKETFINLLFFSLENDNNKKTTLEHPTIKQIIPTKHPSGANSRVKNLLLSLVRFFSVNSWFVELFFIVVSSLTFSLYFKQTKRIMNVSIDEFMDVH